MVEGITAVTMGGIMTVTTVPLEVDMAMGCLRVGIMGELAAQIAGCGMLRVHVSANSAGRRSSLLRARNVEPRCKQGPNSVASAGILGIDRFMA